MRLLIAMGQMLAVLVIVCAMFSVIFAWAAFCYGFGPLRGPVILMAPFVIWAMIALTRMFYKEQP